MHEGQMHLPELRVKIWRLLHIKGEYESAIQRLTETF